jgi:hypothetical protein
MGLIARLGDGFSRQLARITGSSGGFKVGAT